METGSTLWRRKTNRRQDLTSAFSLPLLPPVPSYLTSSASLHFPFSPPLFSMWQYKYKLAYVIDCNRNMWPWTNSELVSIISFTPNRPAPRQLYSLSLPPSLTDVRARSYRLGPHESTLYNEDYWLCQLYVPRNMGGINNSKTLL